MPFLVVGGGDLGGQGEVCVVVMVQGEPAAGGRDPGLEVGQSSAVSVGWCCTIVGDAQHDRPLPVSTRIWRVCAVECRITLVIASRSAECRAAHLVNSVEDGLRRGDDRRQRREGTMKGGLVTSVSPFSGLRHTRTVQPLSAATLR